MSSLLSRLLIAPFCLSAMVLCVEPSYSQLPRPRSENITRNVSVTSFPDNVDVYLDGRPVGKSTPTNLRVPGGEHTIEGHVPDSNDWVPAVQQVTIDASRPVNMSVHLVLKPVVSVGPAGPEGPVGPAGPEGPAGPTGPEGPMGPAGPQGETGAVGPKGETGAVGPIGPIGPAGPRGETGAKGETGAVGPIGPIGPAGAKGETGAVGPKGETGAAGPIGPIGPY
jgi:hypothetical protein